MGLGASLLPLLAVSLLSADALDAGIPPPPDAAAIWVKRCQKCHGEDGSGHTKLGLREGLDDFTTPEWQAVNSDEHLRETIREGSRGNLKMKPFKEVLTPEEIDALVGYLRTLVARHPTEPKKSSAE